MIEKTKTILHVEDDDIKARAVARLVTHYAPHVSIVRAATAEAAFQLGAKFAFDAVITDWNLPQMEGGRATNGVGGAVYRHFETVAPVVVLSGLPGAQGRDKDQAEGYSWITFDAEVRHALAAWLEAAVGRPEE